MKSQLVVLDILAHNDWKRPIYFVTGYHNDAMGLEEYFQLEGLAYRLVPIKSQNKNWLDYGRVKTDILYENMMKKFVWGGAKEKGVYIDYNHKRTLAVVKARYNYARLAKALAAEGKNEKALQVLDYCMDTFPVDKLSYDMYVPDVIEAYFAAGGTEKAIKLSKDMSAYYSAKIEYSLKQDADIVTSSDYDLQMEMQYISRAGIACKSNGQSALGTELSAKADNYYTQLVRILQPSGR
jgi:tetratricopeptide (TPR) repeat protein